MNRVPECAPEDLDRLADLEKDFFTKIYNDIGWKFEIWAPAIQFLIWQVPFHDRSDFFKGNKEGHI